MYKVEVFFFFQIHMLENYFVFIQDIKKTNLSLACEHITPTSLSKG